MRSCRGAENTRLVIRWSRRKPTESAGRPPRGRAPEERFREVEEPALDGPIVEEPEDETEEEAVFFDEFPEYDEEWEADEFTRSGETDPYLPAEAGRGLPVEGPGEAAVVSTVMSRKPGKGAALAVGWTLGILFAVSALYWWGPPGLAEALPASGETVFEHGEGWRLVTAMAAHADAIHLLSNAVFLTWLIYLSYGAFGASLYPWSTVPAAALSLAVTLEGYPPNIRIVGASGLLYLLAGSWLTLYVLVERRLSVPKRLVRVVGFFLVVLVPTSIRPEVSYRAHGIGLFFGICLGLAYFLARRDAIRGAERREWQER